MDATLPLGSPLSSTAVDREKAALVLRKALFRAGEGLGFSQKDVAAIIGVSEATLSRVKRGQALIEPASKEGELSLLLLRIFRSLDALFGGNESDMRSWMHAPNDHLGAVPSDHLLTVLGLVDVVEYLDAMRGHL